MYSLYYNKEKMELIINNSNNLCLNEDKFDENSIYVYNSNYFVSKNKNALKNKANSLKEEWLKEAEERLKTLQNLKIKNKYK